MRKIFGLLLLGLLLALPCLAAQHDYDIANGPGATVRADLNNAFSAIATNNSAATAPTSTYANQWWMDTSTNLLKIRDNGNTAWIVVASKSGTTWIPYRSGAAIGTAATLTTDTDTALAANSDSNVATQKATKAYADAIAADSFSKTTAGEIAALTEKTTTADDDLVLIEDSAASNVKKKVKISNLITAGITIEVITADQTWTAPTGVSVVYVTIAGGGGGGGGNNGAVSGGGGGGAQWGSRIAYPVVAGNNYEIDVGAGGSGGSASGTSGSDGTDSVFNDTQTNGNQEIRAAGGLGGKGGAAGSAGGAAQPADINGRDGAGGDQSWAGQRLFASGSGGNGGNGSTGGGGGSSLGVGGFGAIGASNPTSGGYGGGGGGGDGGQAGAAGGSGIVILEYVL